MGRFEFDFDVYYNGREKIGEIRCPTPHIDDWITINGYDYVVIDVRKTPKHDKWRIIVR